MIPLFAQIAEESTTRGGSFTWLGIMAALAVPCMLLSWYYESSKRRHQRREWEHAERMRMIEMGMPIPARDSGWAKALLCSSIGVGVPLIAFVATSVAHDRPGSADELWIVPALVSGASVLASSLLAGNLFRRNDGAAAISTAHQTGMKPIHDPDAFDVVGSRG